MGTKRKSKEMNEAQAALAAFNKAHKGSTLNDEQKKKLAHLKKDADAEKFRTLGNVRLDRAIRAIDGISKLARLPHSKEQVEKLKSEFEAALRTCFVKFDSKAEINGAKTVRQVL